MSWLWRCSNGHVVGGVDMGTDDETVEALFKDGELLSVTRKP
jgi:hypothetical protein